MALNCQNYTLKQLTNEIERYNREKARYKLTSNMHKAYEEGIRELGREISRRIKLVEQSDKSKEPRKSKTQTPSF